VARVFWFITAEAPGLWGQDRFIGHVANPNCPVENLSCSLLWKEEEEGRRPCSHLEKWFSLSDPIPLISGICIALCNKMCLLFLLI
jgi:hypothetical protein